MNSPIFYQFSLVILCLFALMGLSGCKENTVTQSGLTQSQSGKATQTKNESPYTLEQIREQLEQIYAPAIKKQETLKKLVENPIRYNIATTFKLEKKKGFFIDKTAKVLHKFSKLTNKKIIRDAKSGVLDKELYFVYTHDFFETFRIPYIRRIFLRTTNPVDGKVRLKKLKGIIDKRQSFMRAFCTDRDNRYSKKYADGITDRFEDGITSRRFCLYEADELLIKNFSIHLRNRILLWFFGENDTTGNGVSIIPSMLWKLDTQKPPHKDKKFMKNFVNRNQKWHPFDEYFIEALYSDNVKIGMPITEAIDTMAQHIYQRFSKM